jgi:hypothetical protein
MIIKIDKYELHPSKNGNFFDVYEVIEEKPKVIEYGVPLSYILLKIAHYELNSVDKVYTLKEYIDNIKILIQKYLKNA